MMAGFPSDGAKRGVVVPVAPGTDGDRALRVGVAIANSHHCDVLLVAASPSTRDGSAASSQQQVRSLPSDLEVEQWANDGVSVEVITTDASAVESRISQITSSLEACVLVLETSHQRRPLDRFGRLDAGQVGHRDVCDVISLGGRGDPTTSSSILVPVAGGPNMALSLRCAESIARIADAWVDVFHVLEDGSETDHEGAEALVAQAAETLSVGDTVDTWILEAPDASQAIIEQTDHYDAIVMGGPTRGRLRRFVAGSTTDDVVKEADVPVLTAWAGDTRAAGGSDDDA